jgi:hypothetical protein
MHVVLRNFVAMDSPRAWARPSNARVIALLAYDAAKVSQPPK